MRSPTHSTVCALSRGRMSAKLLMSSAVPIGSREEARYVVPHPLLERREAGIEAGAQQVGDRGLREILVASANRLRHVDVLNARLAAECSEERGRKFAEAARAARPNIEDAADGRGLEQPADHRNRVINIDEVAPLSAVRDVWPVRAEELHRPALAQAIERLGDK